jgi:hypothetical protein
MNALIPEITDQSSLYKILCGNFLKRKVDIEVKMKTRSMQQSPV